MRKRKGPAHQVLQVEAEDLPESISTPEDQESAREERSTQKFIELVTERYGETYLQEGWVEARKIEQHEKDGRLYGRFEKMVGLYPLNELADGTLEKKLQDVYGSGSYILFPCDSLRKRLPGAFTTLAIEPTEKEKKMTKLKEDTEEMIAARERLEAECALAEVKARIDKSGNDINLLKLVEVLAAQKTVDPGNTLATIMALNKTSREEVEAARKEAADQRRHELELAEIKRKADAEERREREDKAERTREAEAARLREELKARDAEIQAREKEATAKLELMRQEMTIQREQLAAKLDLERQGQQEFLKILGQKELDHGRALSEMMIKNAHHQSELMATQQNLLAMMTKNTVDLLDVLKDREGLTKEESEKRGNLGKVIDLAGRVIQSAVDKGQEAAVPGPEQKSLPAPQENKGGANVSIFTRIATERPDIIKKFIAAMKKNLPVEGYVEMVQEFGAMVTTTLMEIDFDEMKETALKLLVREKDKPVSPFLTADERVTISSDQAGAWWARFQARLIKAEEDSVLGETGGDGLPDEPEDADEGADEGAAGGPAED